MPGFNLSVGEEARKESLGDNVSSPRKNGLLDAREEFILSVPAELLDEHWTVALTEKTFSASELNV